jgi:hypothetical protein
MARTMLSWLCLKMRFLFLGIEIEIRSEIAVHPLLSPPMHWVQIQGKTGGQAVGANELCALLSNRSHALRGSFFDRSRGLWGDMDAERPRSYPRADRGNDKDGNIQKVSLFTES